MDKMLSYRNGNIHYSSEGEGDTIVLLHGFIESLNIWNKFSKALYTQNRVIAVDLPGFGKSDLFAEDHSMEFMADCVKAVLEEEKVVDCVMVGHSMGGYVALAFAENYPGLLRGIGLFHSHASADNEEAKENRDRTIAIVEEGKASFIQNFIPTLFAPGNAEKFAGDIEQLQKSMRETPAEGIIAALRGMKHRRGSLNLLLSLDIPIQFIIGKQDPKIPYDKMLSQAALTKHAEITFLDNLGHAGFIEAEKTCLLALQNFARVCFV